MRRVRGALGVGVLATTLPLSGCAALFGGYDLAPNGLPAAEDALRRDLAQRPTDAYLAVIEGRSELPDDDLLRLLYAGTAGRYAGAHAEGAHLLDVASYVAEDRVTMSVSQQALSLLTSDRTLDYVPGATERLMIPYLAAATYLEAGNTDAAAVEARRIEALLDRMADGGSESPDDVTRATRTFLHTFAAAVFEAAGDAGAAEVAYRRAGVADADGPVEAVSGEADAASGAGGGETGEVVILVERGFVPHRVEQSVVVVLPPWQVSLLTDGDAAERALAATEAAARILLAANHYYGGRDRYGTGARYPAGDRYRSRRPPQPVRLTPWTDEDCERYGGDCSESSGSNPYLLRISWPVLYEEPVDRSPLRVRAGEVSGEPVARLDVAAGAGRDFDAGRGTMIARTMLRAASKVALSSAAQGAVEKKDEVAGQVVGLLTNLGTLLTERADTRCWHLLPGEVSMVRLRLPEGSHDLALELSGGQGAGGALSLGSVQVAAGRTTFVTHRVWR